MFKYIVGVLYALLISIGIAPIIWLFIMSLNIDKLFSDDYQLAYTYGVKCASDDNKEKDKKSES